MQVSPCLTACQEPRGDARSVQARSNTMMSKTGINCSKGFRMLVPCTETDPPFVPLAWPY